MSHDKEFPTSEHSAENEFLRPEEPLSGLDTEEAIKRIMAGLSSDEFPNVMEIVRYFARASDDNLSQIIRRLPVHDVMAIQTKYINGKYFAEFSEKMRKTASKEKEVMKLSLKIHEIFTRGNLSTKDINSIRFALKRIIELVSPPKKVTKHSDVFSPVDGLGNLEQHPDRISDELMESTFPDMIKFMNNLDSTELSLKARAEINRVYENSRVRFSTARRREFRRAINRNHEYILECFMSTLEQKFQLHESRLDRVVVDVYHPDLMTYDSYLKHVIKKKMPKLSKDLKRSRIPTQAFIETLEKIAEREQDINIDNIVEQYKQQRAEQLAEGIVYKGVLTTEGEFYKAIVTLDPKKTGAPIRVRLIVNIQSIIQHELFKKRQHTREKYYQQTWAPGSEINFITPGDYEYYYQIEQSTCNIVERTARDLFLELIPEHLGIAVPNPDDLVTYVSQWEVCWEEEFHNRSTDDPAYKKYPVPGLAKHLTELVHNNFPFTRKYANYKVELETMRPSFNCDLPCMDPTLPMMQFKVYPKYRYKVTNAIMLRHEIIAGSFFKEFGKTGPDSLPLSMKVLSNPEYCRETAERLLQLELYLNGQEGLGYNERFRIPTPNEYVVWLNNLTKFAIFGKRADNYTSEYQAFLDSGKLHKSIPRHFRKKMQKLELDKFHHRALNQFRDMGEDET